MALFECFKCKAPQKFVKNFIRWNPRKFSPANLSPFTVINKASKMATKICETNIIPV